MEDITTTPPRKSRMGYYFLGIAGLMAALTLVPILAGWEARQDPRRDRRGLPAPSPSFLQARAEDMASQYSANELRADGYYKDERLRVIGTIENIGRNMQGYPYLVLKGSGALDIQAFFTKGSEAELARLAKGREIAVKCIGGGKQFNVQLHSCAID